VVIEKLLLLKKQRKARDKEAETEILDPLFNRGDFHSNRQ
jgi:hypothetical protein